MEMVKRIDLFMPPEDKSRYSVLPHFTLKMMEALTRAGVSCRLLKSEKNNPKPFLENLFKDPPDCTLSFNGLLPDEEGRFFCDTIKIPHIACLIDSPTQYLALAGSPYTVITVPDRFSANFLKGLECNRVIFMPHGIEPDLLKSSKGKEKKFDIVMLSSCIDYHAMEDEWKRKYSKEMVDLMHEASDLALHSKEISCIQAFVQTMDQYISAGKLKPEPLNFPEIIDQIEIHTKGKDRVELLKAVKDIPIHIFGNSIELWKKYLGEQTKNIELHEPVNFELAMEIMRQSKVLLNSCAWLKDGTHERILAGIANGALVLTNENIYMNEHFTDGDNIALYPAGKWELVPEKLQEYLSNETKRKKTVEKGQELVLKHHTWDQRVKTLLKELPAILKRIKSST
jgi:glycosyltransferase involved in cell wall biosynthesis